MKQKPLIRGQRVHRVTSVCKEEQNWCIMIYASKHRQVLTQFQQNVFYGMSLNSIFKDYVFSGNKHSRKIKVIFKCFPSMTPRCLH